MKRIILVLLAAMSFAAAAHAEPGEITGRVTVTPPTTYADNPDTPDINEAGTPMPASAITKYTLKWGFAPGAYTQKVDLTPAQVATPYTWVSSIEPPAGGGIVTVYYVMSAWTTREGANSAEAKKPFAFTAETVPSAPSISVGTWTCIAPSGFKCVVLP
jgi:hypothetical protein